MARRRGGPRIDSNDASCVRGLNAWCWVLVLLGLARRRLDFTHPLLSRATEAAYPRYILHQTVIVALDSSWFILTLSLYELVVRRLALARFLFG